MDKCPSSCWCRWCRTRHRGRTPARPNNTTTKTNVSTLTSTATQTAHKLLLRQSTANCNYRLLLRQQRKLLHRPLPRLQLKTSTVQPSFLPPLSADVQARAQGVVNNLIEQTCWRDDSQELWPFSGNEYSIKPLQFENEERSHRLFLNLQPIS